MNPEFMFHLRALTRILYFVTDEEDRFLVNLQNALKKYAERTKVFNAAFGLVSLTSLINDWGTREHKESSCMTIHESLIQVYKDDPKDEQNFYVFTDPERWLSDPHVVRRVLNILHQLHHDIRNIKVLIFVGTRRYIPEKLQRYVEVVNDTGLSEEEILEIVKPACDNLQTAVPKDYGKIFRGMTSYEIASAISQSIVRTKKDTVDPKRVDPAWINDFRRRQLSKTDLVQYVDTSQFNFGVVGGTERFKQWAYKTRWSWTQKGQAFGLRPPKGILAVGVWGCGKSLSVKAMGHAWGLPVVQLEMGRLRSSGVGESEANVYRAIRIIEAASPCVVWIDEAEKSLSGGQSSAQSDAGTTSRTIGILSTWLQETTAPVCLAMTANSLKTLPVEFINRMDERFFFDIPSEEDRIEILKIHIRKAGQKSDAFDLAMLAEKAKGMVGREIEQAIGSAMIESFAQEKATLDEGILADELARKPRIMKTMVDEVKELTEWVGYDPDCDDGIRARFASKPNNSALKLVGSDE